MNAVDAKFCIFNLWSISQAGRRGFDPRLPLHLFNNLRTAVKSVLRLCSVYNSCSSKLLEMHG